jgi:hypothetical protein
LIRWTHCLCLISVTKVPDIWTYQNEHNQGDLYLTVVVENDYRDRLDITYVLLNFPRYLSILLLQTGKTDSNALDIDAVYNLKLRKT